MKYDLFLFDLDDTLLDFKKSEELSFFLTLQELGLQTGLNDLFNQYQVENSALWRMFEQNLTTKEHLKVERFRRIFKANGIDLDPERASSRYLDSLPQTVVLMDYAVELCEWLTQHGELGIITNGMHQVQQQRIKNSKLAPYISFVSVSEECGFAKPDVRFFEFTSRLAKKFSKASTIIVGDRIEADIQGALNFGIDSCWFNPEKLRHPLHLAPTYEISHLADLKKVLLELAPIA